MAGHQDIIGGNDNYQSTAAANNIWWHVQRVIVRKWRRKRRKKAILFPSKATWIARGAARQSRISARYQNPRSSHITSNVMMQRLGKVDTWWDTKKLKYNLRATSSHLTILKCSKQSYGILGYSKIPTVIVNFLATAKQRRHRYNLLMPLKTHYALDSPPIHSAFRKKNIIGNIPLLFLPFKVL